MARRRNRAGAKQATAALNSEPELASTARLLARSVLRASAVHLASPTALLALSWFCFLATFVYVGATFHDHLHASGQLQAFLATARGFSDAGCETLRSHRLPRLLLTRCGVSSFQLARVPSLVCAHGTLLAAACTTAVLAVMIGVSLWRARTRVAMQPLESRATTPQQRPTIPPTCVPARVSLPPPPTQGPVAAPLPKRGKRGGQGNHVAARELARDLARLERFEEYVFRHKWLKHVEKGSDESDDSHDDKHWVHPADAYFGEVCPGELAGLGLGYTSDECDDDDAGYYEYGAFSKELCTHAAA
jgi:hypothetical protein